MLFITASKNQSQNFLLELLNYPYAANSLVLLHKWNMHTVDQSAFSSCCLFIKGKFICQFSTRNSFKLHCSFKIKVTFILLLTIFLSAQQYKVWSDVTTLWTSARLPTWALNSKCFLAGFASWFQSILCYIPRARHIFIDYQF